MPKSPVLSSEMEEYIKKVNDKFYNSDAIKNVLSIELPPNGISFQSDGFDGGVASGMKVLGIQSDHTACGNFRVHYPMRVLASQGAKVVSRVVTPEFQISLKDFYDADFIYLQRAADPNLLKFCNDLQVTAGKTIVYDLDDHLHSVAKSSPAYWTYNLNTDLGKTTLNGIEGFIKESTGCIFSTRELQAMYGPIARQSHVLLNGVDFTLEDRDWSEENPLDWRSLADQQGCVVDSDTVNIFWSGGSTHKVDLEVLGTSIKDILNKVPNSILCIQSHPDLITHFCITKWNLPMERICYIPATQFKNYPKSLSAADVSIIPLESSVFNASKSDLRILENCSFGAPYVASNVAPYTRFHKQTKGLGGYIADSQYDFVSMTTKLLQDKDLRLEKGSWIKNYIRTEYDIRNTMSTLHYTLKSFQASQSSKYNIKPRAMLDIKDEVRGIPKLPNKLIGLKNNPCPCGSNRKYSKCCGSGRSKPWG